MDVATAMEGLDTCSRVLQSWCEEPEGTFAEILGKAQKIQDALDVDIRPPRCASRSQYRANAGDCEDAGAYYRINCFLPLFHSVLRQLRARFGERQQVSFKLCGLLPAHLKPWEDVHTAVMRYAKFLDQEQLVRAELQLWHTMWAGKQDQARPASAVAALDACPRETLPNISRLFQILAALPVTTAEPERFFSRVTLAASCIRAAMSEERLEAICLQVYRNCPVVTVDTVLQQFSKSKRNMDLIL